MKINLVPKLNLVLKKQQKDFWNQFKEKMRKQAVFNLFCKVKINFSIKERTKITA